MTPPLQQTKNSIECHRCGDTITEWCETRRFGFWDTEKQHYESHGGIEHHYCRACWQEREGRTNGAHYFPESSEELWDVLEAADGDLVAILCWWSGRPAIRVVDGDVEAAVTKPNHGGTTDDGTPILNFESEYIDDFDEEQFHEDADPPDTEGLNLVLLRNPEQTPFAALGGDADA